MGIEKQESNFPGFLALDYNPDGEVYLQCYKPLSEKQLKINRHIFQEDQVFQAANS